MCALVTVLLLVGYMLRPGRDGVWHLLLVPWGKNLTHSRDLMYSGGSELKRRDSLGRECKRLSLFSLTLLQIRDRATSLRLGLRLLLSGWGKETSPYWALTMCLAPNRHHFINLPSNPLQLVLLPPFYIQMGKWGHWGICSPEWFSFQSFLRPHLAILLAWKTQFLWSIRSLCGHIAFRKALLLSSRLRRERLSSLSTQRRIYQNG